mgnify:CR=1 FL=1
MTALELRLRQALQPWRAAPAWRVAFSGGLDSSVLVHLLAERFKITKAVGRYKATVDLPAADEGRERVQIERLRALAEELDREPH